MNFFFANRMSIFSLAAQTDKLQDLAFELTSTYFGDFFTAQQQASIDRLQAAACFL
jgi:hypothetical protein